MRVDDRWGKWSSHNKLFNQDISAKALGTPRYSTSALDRDTLCSCLDDQEMRLSPRKTKNHEVDRRVTGHNLHQNKQWKPWRVRSTIGVHDQEFPKYTSKCIWKRGSVALCGSCMYRQICWTANEMSGWVNVRYWSAPARWWYNEGSETGVPPFPSFANRSKGVRLELASIMMARWRISEAYFYWKKNMPHDDFVKKIPKKQFKSPKSLMENSLPRVVMMWQSRWGGGGSC